MSEQYYVLELDEPAEASFCSFSKQYFGTLKDMEIVMKAMEEDGDYENTVAAWKEYQSGNHDAKHSVAYASRFLLRPVKLIATAEAELKRRKWDHINVWNSPYPMKTTGGVASQVIFKYEDKYYRCIRATLKDLKYGGITGEWNNIRSLWGNAAVIKKERLAKGHYTISNLLYVIEDEHDSLEGLEDLIQNPNEIKFDKICDEIFADG